MIINVGYQCLSNMFINGYQRKHVYNCFSMIIQQKWDQSSRQDDFIQQTIVDPTKVPQKLGSGAVGFRKNTSNAEFSCLSKKIKG